MRALSASVVLSSIILGGWLTGARAQSADLDLPAGQGSTPGAQVGGQENLPPGTIPQPTPDSPGTIWGVTLGELYTDNLRLAGPGEPKQSIWITQVRPFVRAAYGSPRFSGIVNYSLTGYLYAGHGSYNQLTQDLDARGRLTLLPQHFFLDGSVFYGSQIINNQLPAGNSPYLLDNNRANVGTAMLSPYWLQDLGRAGTMTLRYTHGRVVYNQRGISQHDESALSGIPNVTSNAAQFSLISPEHETWGWSLGYSEQRLDPDFGPSVDFAVARAGVSRQVSINTRLLADVGKENKFLADGTVKKLDATFWDAGIEWSNGRDIFKATAGHRFYGHSYQLSWTHHAALLTTNVSYREQPTSYNQRLLGQSPGAVMLPPTNVRPHIPSLTERQPYLSKRLSISASYTMPTSVLRATVYDESRTYFAQDRGDERVANANVSWRFSLGPFTTLTPLVRWQRYRFQDGQVSYTRYAQLALVHQINARNFGSVRVRHGNSSVHQGSPGAHGYEVNEFLVQWTHLF